MFDKVVEFLTSFLHVFYFCTITMSYQRGVVLRWGRKHREIGPGFHWRWPFRIEHVITCNVAIETMSVGPQSLTTKDGRSVVLSSIVTFQISDAAKFLLEVEGGHQAIEDSAYGQIADFVMKHTWEQLCAEDSLSNELTKVVRRRAKNYGVDIVSVQVADFTASKSLRLIQPLSHRSHVG